MEPNTTLCPTCGAPLNGPFCSQCGHAATAGPATLIDAPTADGTQFLQAVPPARRPANAPPALRSSHVPSVEGAPTPTLDSTDNNRFTEAAGYVLNTVGERTVWQGKPSPIYLIKGIVVWILVVGLAAYGLSQLPTLPFDGAWVIVTLAAWALLKIGWSWLRLRNTLYRLSSQRLEKTDGVFGRTSVTVELLNIKRAVITEPFPWRLFGLGNLELDASTGERWTLMGIRDVRTVRDLIHSSSGITGQLWDQRRFGA